MKKLGYSEDEDGHVVITMTRDDYGELLIALGWYMGAAYQRGMTLFPDGLNLMNRLNDGNPHWSPHKMAE